MRSSMVERHPQTLLPSVQFIPGADQTLAEALAIDSGPLCQSADDRTSFRVKPGN